MDVLICPACGEHLIVSDRTLTCPNRHMFDRAASGYVNLLLSCDKHAKVPGDSHEMVLARRRFLSEGYYEKLRNAIAEKLSEQKVRVLLDAGCGEGYYTNELAKVSKHTIGVDLSKDAVNRASKAGEHALYCVGSIFKLPVHDQRIDALTSIFAPYSASEFSRVVMPGGRVIAVIPGREHLWGLKEVLYEKPYYNDEKGYDLPDFTLVDTLNISYDIQVVGNERIMDLLMMTPYYWKTPQNAVEHLSKINQLDTPVSFQILSYRKN